MALLSSIPAERVSLSMALGRTVPVEHARPVGDGAEDVLPDLWEPRPRNDHRPCGRLRHPPHGDAPRSRPARLVAFLVASLLPEATLYAISAAKFVLTINALVVWRPVDPEIAPR